MKIIGDSLERYAAYIQAAKLGIFASAALLAYVLQPYVNFLPGNTIISALMLSSAVIGFSAAEMNSDRVRLAANAVVGLAGIGFLASAFLNAGDRLFANERRCAAIQHHMLMSAVGRADDAAMFSAFGCRPTGDQSISYPRNAVGPSAREKPTRVTQP
ncbi:hypothetical protein E5673_08205 [Sphingomonas sp. PAMC26645]|uniref:hypothetical protein n=1 Tax=Sphingomonas sp. PAMC26645 TaxID=2565555 RepID=UPI00109DC6FF|nr:hypothetical protein [Sphingomonas sp. PAMC26645]QCB42215.1 hypothetical protein E5673_08205 [Sphingomonas sp. PAMC26645]